ncbi:hypothetical protein BC332_09767 [Capsicum chinense]|nr:hypothetical protein BC332_09767 [Capsicum chinense]
MTIKLVIRGFTLNVCSAYAPQVGSEGEEKIRFWEALEEVVRGVPSSEKIVVAGDFNGYIGALPGGFGEVHGGFGFGERNEEGAILLEFERAFGLVVVNSGFPKKDEHLITFQSAIARTQIDFLLLRKGDRALCKDCKVIPSENLSTQHRLLVMDLGQWRFGGISISVTPLLSSVSVGNVKNLSDCTTIRYDFDIEDVLLAGKKSAISFLTGGIGGFLYSLLVQRSVDGIPSSELTSITSIAAKYALGDVARVCIVGIRNVQMSAVSQRIFIDDAFNFLNQRKTQKVLHEGSKLLECGSGVYPRRGLIMPRCTNLWNKLAYNSPIGVKLSIDFCLISLFGLDQKSGLEGLWILSVKRKFRRSEEARLLDDPKKQKLHMGVELQKWELKVEPSMR